MRTLIVRMAQYIDPQPAIKQGDLSEIEPELSSQSVLDILDTTIGSRDDLTYKEKQQLKELLKQGKHLNILIVGKKNTGKSAILNGLVGKVVFDEATDDEIESSSQTIKCHSFQKHGILVTVWDSPGLEDGTNNDYMGQIRDECKDIDLLIYCASMKQTRAVNLSVSASSLKTISDGLGNEIWKHSLIVLTYGNTYANRLKMKQVEDIDKKFEEKVEDWRKRLHQALNEIGVDKSIVDSIPVKPAGYYKEPKLPGYLFWLSNNIWATAMERMEEKNRALLMIVNAERFKAESEVRPEDFVTSSDQPIVLTKEVIAASVKVDVDSSPPIAAHTQIPEEQTSLTEKKSSFSAMDYVRLVAQRAANILVNWYRRRQRRNLNAKPIESEL